MFEESGNVRVFGTGSLGGKGEGLVQLDSWEIPGVEKLKSTILATSFFDKYNDQGKEFGEEELSILRNVLEDMGDSPIGARSSATNEASLSSGEYGSVNAGENISFMLPNNHPDESIRAEQLKLAIYHIYEDFLRKQPPDSVEKMAVIINPIPGLFDDTHAGPFYYPYISGVANSYFPYALKAQGADEGFARVAFGHGYAAVLDDFPVICMATIKNPIPVHLMRTGQGQQYFYALDMTKNSQLGGDELETMSTLHVRFANFHKIRLLGMKQDVITIEELVQNDHYGFRTGLNAIMDSIRERVSSHFQIEFVFNLNFSNNPPKEGHFHIVQLTRLPRMRFDTIQTPENPKHVYLATKAPQGHGVIGGIKHAVVVSPFAYTKDRHDHTRTKISGINQAFRESGEKYILIVPGRLGSTNRDWGLEVTYRDVSQAAGIFEYGVDICGRAEPAVDDDSMTGGVYGSHFLYMIQGGYDEDQRRLQARIYGTQGTHFLTNLISNNVIYAYVAPTEDRMDPWFFKPPATGETVALLDFPSSVTIYADTINQCCSVIA